jgi:hypothetical protein
MTVTAEQGRVLSTPIPINKSKDTCTLNYRLKTLDRRLPTILICLRTLNLTVKRIQLRLEKRTRCKRTTDSLVVVGGVRQSNLRHDDSVKRQDEIHRTHWPVCSCKYAE